MKHLLITSALLMLVSNLAAATEVQPVQFKASYGVSKGNLALGEVHRSLTATDDGKYSFVSVTQPTGLAAAFIGRIEEHSLLAYHDHQIKPLHYEKSGDKKNNLNLLFDWEHALVKNNIEGNLWELPLSLGTQDLLSYQLAIIYDLQQGKTNLAYVLTDKHKFTSYQFQILGEEKLDTPLGPMQTLKLQRITDSADKTTIIWCAPSLDYLPARIEQNGFSMVIRSVEGFKSPAH